MIELRLVQRARSLYNEVMLVLNTQLQNIPIMSLQSGGSLGMAAEPIIDPRKLQIVAYHVTGPRIQEPSILYTSDIREIGPLGLIVDHADRVMTLDEDLVRLQEVISLNFTLIGKTVFDDQKKRLGKVIEYTVESETFLIQKLHLGQSLLKNIKSSGLLIHRSQIVEVTDKKIIVRSATVQEQVSLMQAVNPFRKSQALAPDTKDLVQ